MNLILCSRSFRKPALAIMEDSAQSATTVIDPVCGMNVDPATAKHKLNYAGKTYYFCCAPCLEKFRDHPLEYVAAGPAAAGLRAVSIATGAKAPAKTVSSTAA